VYPDAHFSAYGMVVDWVVGGGLHLSGRTVMLAGEPTPFEEALCAELHARGARIGSRISGPGDARLRDTDVLLLCDPGTAAPPLLEALATATRQRPLPPEAWVACAGANGTVRHYYTDARILHRTLDMTSALDDDAEAMRRAARVTVFFLRRGARWVPTTAGPGAWRAYRRFRRAVPVCPPGVMAGSRAQLAAAHSR
jgi:hypothetical protein